MKNKYSYLLSIIVPIYGVEQYIPKFFESIKQNNIDSTEIILVNDGSKDNSGKLAKQFAESNSSFVTYIQKNNGGVSSARNLGLKYATGQYIVFADPDDFLESNYISTIIKTINDYNFPDMILFDANVICNNQILTNCRSNNVFNKGIVNKEIFLKELVKDEKISGSLCNKVIKATHYTNICFDENIRILEDSKLLTNIISSINTIAYIPLPLYNYLIRNDSAIRTQSIEDQKKCFDIAMERYIAVKKLIKNCSLNFPTRICLEIIENSIFSGRTASEYAQYRQFITQNIGNIIKDKGMRFIIKKRCILVYLNLFSIYLKYKKMRKSWLA